MTALANRGVQGVVRFGAKHLYGNNCSNRGDVKIEFEIALLTVPLTELVVGVDNDALDELSSTGEKGADDDGEAGNSMDSWEMRILDFLEFEIST